MQTVFQSSIRILPLLALALLAAGGLAATAGPRPLPPPPDTVPPRGATTTLEAVRLSPHRCADDDCAVLEEALDAAADGYEAMAGPPDDVGDFEGTFRLFGLPECYVPREYDDYGCASPRVSEAEARRLYSQLTSKVAQCLGADWSRRERQRDGGKLVTEFRRGQDPINVSVGLSVSSRGGWYARVNIGNDDL